MKKLLFLFTFVSGFAFAQSTNITVNPLGLLLGTANLGVEFKVSDNLTVGPSASFSHIKSGSESATGFGLGAKLDVYLSSDAFTDSWVLTPFFGWGRYSNNDDSINAFAGGVVFGYYWIWPSGFNMNFGLGIQYISADFDEIGLGDVSAVLPAGNFSLGYAF